MSTQLLCCLLTALVSVTTGYWISVLANQTSKSGLDWRILLGLIGVSSLLGYSSYLICIWLNAEVSYKEKSLGTFAERVDEDSMHVELCIVEVTQDKEGGLKIEGSAYAIIKNDTLLVGKFYSNDAKFDGTKPLLRYKFSGFEGNIQFGKTEEDMGFGEVMFYDDSNGPFQFGKGYFNSPVCNCRREITLVRLKDKSLKKISNQKELFQKIYFTLIKNSDKINLVKKPFKRKSPTLPQSDSDTISQPETFHVNKSLFSLL